MCRSPGELCGVCEALLAAHLAAAQPQVCSEMAPGSDKASGLLFHLASWSAILAACPGGHLAASEANRQCHPLIIPEPPAPLSALLTECENIDCFHPRTD